MTMTDADITLVRRLETGWAWSACASARAMAALRPQAGIAWSRIGRGAAVFFGPDSPLSQAQGLGLDGPVGEDTLERLESFFHSRGVPVAVEVATLADPGLMPALSARGYHITEVTHTLVRPISDDRIDAVTPLDLTVAAVDPADRAAVAESREVVLRGFFEGPDDPPTWLTDVLEILTAAEGATVWLARCGVPGVDLHLPAVAVGGAVLLVHDCLALFAGDATLPGFRRKGVQTSLIRARLAAAARLGCDLAVACTQPGSGSERNYERQGFRLVYARILLTRPLPASPG